MAGAKASKEEKAAIRQLFKDGYSIAEVMSKYPHLDGRVVSGLRAKMQQELGIVPAAPAPSSTAAPPSAGGFPSSAAVSPSAAPVAPEAVSAPPSPPSPPVVSPPPRVAAPVAAPGFGGLKSPEIEVAETVGFTPVSSSSRMPEGFIPSYREYYIVKKLDGLDAGIKDQHFPPFGIAEFMRIYRDPGEYEISRYVDGRLAGTFRERVAPQRTIVTMETPKADSPTDSFFRALEAVRNLQQDRKQEESQMKMVEATAMAEKAKAQAHVEATTTTGLIELVKTATAPKPDGISSHLSMLMEMASKQLEAAEARHKMEMEELRERQRHEMEIERERIKAENERFKEEMRQRQKERDDFLAKMAEIEAKRDQFHRESYDRMIGEISQSREAAEREIEERKNAAKELIEVQRKFNDEIIELRKRMGSSATDIEVAKIVKDGVVSGLDRLGHRVDLILGQQNRIQTSVNATDVSAGRLLAPEESGRSQTGAEKQMMMTDDEASQEVRKPWFSNLKAEIIQTLKARAAGRKLHGGILGQLFIENLNERRGVTVAHLHWLCSRTWEQVLDKAKEALSEEEMKILATPDGKAWYEEFVWFLSESYNNSLAIARRA